MSLVWDSTVPAPERFTLLALADRADEEGHCYPSVMYLSRKCATSDRTIQRHLVSLEEMGLLVRRAEKGSTTHYFIQLDLLRRMQLPPIVRSTDCHPRQSVTPDRLSPPTDCPETPDNLSSNPRQSVTQSLKDPYKHPKEPPPPSADAADAPRDDVEALCQTMIDCLTRLDIRPRPRVTKEWRKQARLLLDVDERELPKALRLIEWATADTFWSQNIHSIPTFRKQYDKLRMAALREHAERTGTPLRSVPPVPRSFEDLLEAADVDAARRLIRANYLMPDHMPGNPMTLPQWRRHCAREWITEHEAPIRAALERSDSA